MISFPATSSIICPLGSPELVVSAMSSMDSGVNSITAVVMTDFLDRFGLRPKIERGRIRFAQLLAFGIGVAVVVVSSLIQHVPGNYFAVTNKTDGLLATPIFALFVFALCVPFGQAGGSVVRSRMRYSHGCTDHLFWPDLWHGS